MTNPASQQPAPIPEDLKELYELSKRAKLAGREMVYCSLIERIGRAEAAATAYALDVGRLEAALTALRDFMWSEGYADQTAVMGQADLALAAPLGTPGKGEK